MTDRRTGAAAVGLGVAACAACCAAPVVGTITAIGVGTAAGLAVIGGLAWIVGAVAVGLVVWRRRRQRMVGCARPGPVGPVAVDLSAPPPPSRRPRDDRDA